MIQNHNQGWIEVKKEFDLGKYSFISTQNTIYRFFNEEEEKVPTNLSSKLPSDPKYIVKIYDPEQNSNTIQIFTFLSSALQAVSKIK